jgi:hypothetical protein
LSALHRNSTLTTDSTDNTDLHGSQKFDQDIFEFVNPCHPCSSVVSFAFLCKAALERRACLIRRRGRLRSRIKERSQAYLQSALTIASGTAVLCEAMLLRNHPASELCPLRAQQVMNGRQALPPQSADVVHRIPQPHAQKPDCPGATVAPPSGCDARSAVWGSMSGEITLFSERSGIR